MRPLLQTLDGLGKRLVRRGRVYRAEDGEALRIGAVVEGGRVVEPPQVLPHESFGFPVAYAARCHIDQIRRDRREKHHGIGSKIGMAQEDVVFSMAIRPWSFLRCVYIPGSTTGIYLVEGLAVVGIGVNHVLFDIGE